MATTIRINNSPIGTRSIVSNGKHSILSDKQVTTGGGDIGFSPADMVIAGVSMCKLTTMRNIAGRKGWPIGNLFAEIRHGVAEASNGSLLSTIRPEIKIDGDLSEQQKAILIKEANDCYVSRLVQGDWEFLDSGYPELERSNLLLAA